MKWKLGGDGEMEGWRGERGTGGGVREGRGRKGSLYKGWRHDGAERVAREGRGMEGERDGRRSDGQRHMGSSECLREQEQGEGEGLNEVGGG